MAWGITQLVAVRKFLQDLPDGLRSKAHGYIILLANNGPRLTYPYSKKVGPNLFELRIKGREAVRIFYCFYKNQIYLLHAFRKKSQKLPPREIKTAIDRMRRII